MSTLRDYIGKLCFCGFSLVMFLSVAATAQQSIESSFTSLVVPQGNKMEICNPVFFDAEKTGDKRVTVKWSVPANASTSHFIIQRSDNGKTFYDAVVVFSEEEKNSSKLNYHFCDENFNASNSGVIYYRMKVVDQKGKYTYSKQLAVPMKLVSQQMRSL